MVAAVECRKQLRRIVWIAHHLVEIDHGVEFAAGANPGIDGLTLDLMRWAEVRGAHIVERRQGGAVDANAAAVGAGNQLAIAADDVVGGGRLGLAATAKTGVRDAEPNPPLRDRRRRPRLASTTSAPLVSGAY